MSDTTTSNVNACESCQHFTICLYRVKHGWTTCSAFDRRIDRDALLALADEMHRNTQGMLSDDPVDASDVWYYEHLLRKAVGA